MYGKVSNKTLIYVKYNSLQNYCCWTRYS